MNYQPPLPQEYLALPREQLMDRIARQKAALGGSLVILGHHYQSDDIIQFADFVGDSLRLSQQAAAVKDVKYIVFCGVHFMAESADILSRGRAAVILPHLMAGCTMADMADDESAAVAIDELSHAAGEPVVPVTYVNSTAAMKALTARAGGACCTSSNARGVFQWALRWHGHPGRESQAKKTSTTIDTAKTPVPPRNKILAIPDQHLGLNTAMALGYRGEDCVVYNPKLHMGGLTAEQVRAATFILWKGQCYVHQRFKPQEVQAVRQRHPGIKVIVHPECPHEVVALADASGSTEQIISAVEASPPGSAWAIGTETNLVLRLARKHPDKTIRLLADTPAFCTQMGRIDLPHLLFVLDNLAQGRIVNQVRVEPSIAAEARAALERMIQIPRSS